MTRFITPILTFVIGVLAGGIYGFLLANRKWNEAFEEMQQNQRKALMEQIGQFDLEEWR